MPVQIDTRFALQRRVNLPYDPFLVVFRPHGKLSPHVLRLHRMVFTDWSNGNATFFYL